MQITRAFFFSLALVLIAGSFACKKKEPEPPKPKTETVTPSTPEGTPSTTTRTAQPSPDDEMTAALKKLAGAEAKDCGTVPGKGGDVGSASACAMDTNDQKKSFWVRYELPMPGSQMAIATARATDGKLYTMQYSADGYKQASAGATLSADKKLLTVTCPEAPLRVASSGRVTCFTPQQVGGNVSASPHGGGMAMPPGAANPHGKMPPASGQSPRGTNPPPATAKSH